jgi:UDP-3-O-[3-hydroxymyristoyl] N-acetylglucosamine deacetylase
VIGDMALLGFPVLGHLVAHRGGHALHTAFAARILEERDRWELVEEPAIPALPVPASAPLGAAISAER